MFFDGWRDLLAVLAVGVPAYLALVVMLRVSGKHTLSKMNGFDFVVTVAIGSTLASTLTSQDVTLAEGAMALGLLILLQFIVTWIAARSPAFNHLIKDEPAMVAYRGRLLRQTMRRERVTDDEVLAAVREQGLSSLDEVEAVVLQSSSQFAVVKRHQRPGPADALRGVRGPDGAKPETDPSS